MYCDNCGTEIPSGVNFCSNCGVEVGRGTKVAEVVDAPAKQRVNYPGTKPQYVLSRYKEKDPAIALLLSILLMVGAGHIFVGKVGKGVGLIFGALCTVGVIYGGAFVMAFAELFTLGIVMMVIATISAAFIGIYGHINAYKTANKYNDFLHINGRPPTSADNW